jgi:prepilin-type N-terminal cleavage/methylation domain-containing protein
LLGEGGVRNIRRLRFITGKGGFTILEVMVAISILAVGLMAVFTAQSRSITGNTDANRQTEAMTLAQDKMEELLAVPYEDLDEGSFSATVPGGYGLAWTVAASTDNYKLIEVEVAGKGLRKKLELKCIKTRL